MTATKKTNPIQPSILKRELSPRGADEFFGRLHQERKELDNRRRELVLGAAEEALGKLPFAP